MNCIFKSQKPFELPILSSLLSLIMGSTNKLLVPFFRFVQKEIRRYFIYRMRNLDFAKKRHRSVTIINHDK